MRRIEERKKHDKLRGTSTRRATRLFFIPLKINKFYKNVPCWLGVIFCRRLTTNTAFPVFVGCGWHRGKAGDLMACSEGFNPGCLVDVVYPVCFVGYPDCLFDTVQLN